MSDYPSAPEDLADVWGSAVRWTFMFGLGPVRFRGATGSPATPIALF